MLRIIPKSNYPRNPEIPITRGAETETRCREWGGDEDEEEEEEAPHDITCPCEDCMQNYPERFDEDGENIYYVPPEDKEDDSKPMISKIDATGLLNAYTGRIHQIQALNVVRDAAANAGDTADLSCTMAALMSSYGNTPNA